MTDAELEQIDREGFVDAACDSCGAFATVEPDAEGIECPEECGGTLTSPMRAAGLI